MLYVFIFVMGSVAGAVCVFLVLINKRMALNDQKSKQKAEAARIQETVKKIKAKQAEFDQKVARLKEIQERLQIVSYQEMQEESILLKRDLQNVDVDLRKLQLDGQRRSGEREPRRPPGRPERQDRPSPRPAGAGR